MAKANGNGNGHIIKGKGGTLWMHRSYNNVEKNPDIDKFRTFFQKVHVKEDDLAAIAGLSTSTVKNMFGGKTRDPRSSTFQKMAKSLGCEYVLQETKPVNYEKEIPKAKEERKSYMVMLQTKREKANTKSK